MLAMNRIFRVHFPKGKNGDCWCVSPLTAVNDFSHLEMDRISRGENPFNFMVDVKCAVDARTISKHQINYLEVFFFTQPMWIHFYTSSSTYLPCANFPIPKIPFLFYCLTWAVVPLLKAQQLNANAESCKVSHIAQLIRWPCHLMFSSIQHFRRFQITEPFNGQKQYLIPTNVMYIERRWYRLANVLGAHNQRWNMYVVDITEKWLAKCLRAHRTQWENST